MAGPLGGRDRAVAEIPATPAALTRIAAGLACGTVRASSTLVTASDEPTEHARRSAAKAITYRAGGVTLDLVGVYVITGRVMLAIGFTIVVNVCALFGYYLHERIWAHVRWARGH